MMAVLTCTFGALIYWGLESYTTSSASIQRIVKPNHPSIQVNELYKSVIKSDLYLNNFVLTGDSLQWVRSQRYASRIDSLIETLEQHEHLWLPLLEWDTLKTILAEKNRVSTALMKLKQKQGAYFFTERALSRIRQQLSDTAYTDKLLVKRQSFIMRRDTIERIAFATKPNESKGIRGFFRRLFGKKQIKTDTVITREAAGSQDLAVSVDSSIVRDHVADTTLAAVKGILAAVLDEEIRSRHQLDRTELELITYNKRLLQHIWSLLDMLSQSYETSLRAEQASITAQIKSSHKQAFAIAGAGVCMGVLLLILLLKDISQTNLYRHRLEREKERAEELAAAKEVFLSKMSHEIRTPLHSMAGFVQLLAEEPVSVRAQRLVEGISQANRYLSSLIGNILEQARIHAGTFRTTPGQLYIPDMCHELALLFEHRQREQHNHFDIRYAERLRENLLITDGIRLRQVLINLLENAFRFTEHGRVALWVELSDESDSSWLLLRVSDTGIGIDPKEHLSVFEPFKQGSHQRPGGTGLGLSISRHIVTQLGGSIDLDSSTRQGSTFSVRVPVTCQPYVPPVKVAADRVEVPRYDIRVLAVEDDAWNAYLLEQYLAEHVQVLTCLDNAEQALALLAEQPAAYDLIITDIQLPGMDGAAFCRAAKGLGPFRCVALSAGLTQDHYAEWMHSGFDGILGKPFDQAVLLEEIGRWFEALPASQTRIQPDLRRLLAFWAGDPAWPAHYKAFAVSFAHKVRDFGLALAQQDAAWLGRLAHQLKSNCEQVGVDLLSEDLHTIEWCAAHGHHAKALLLAGEQTSRLSALAEALHGLVPGADQASVGVDSSDKV